MEAEENNSGSLNMKHIYQGLNDKQEEAVFYTEGPLLILAGAGSGKTRVLMHRIAYLIEKGVNPYHIMAVTFTNKAAASMRERLAEIVGEVEASQVWATTFHSGCVRILRRFIEKLGYGSDFGIYDGDDQKTLLKKLIKNLQLNDKTYKPRDIGAFISRAKDELKSPEQSLAEAEDLYERNLAKVYMEYQKELKKNNALDFDDLIVKSIALFEQDAEVLDYYRERFRYIMVDEYQDTNTAQFRLIELLSGKYRNLCVVGDDDQSIYKFRGANIGNILNFETVFPDCRVIRLEQNYRSKGNILEAANAVIRHNLGRKGKTLWTERDAGERIRLWQFSTAVEEADAIIRDIRERAGRDEYNDYAVLYRTNAQSRVLEERCIQLNVPYQLVGGVNFYQRKEIKDILAYLKTIYSGKDDLAFGRIINVPKRGIGESGMTKLSAFASEHGLALYEAAELSYQIEGLKKAGANLVEFCKLIRACRQQLESGMDIASLIACVMEETGYEEYLMQEGEIEGQTRLDNIQELMNKAGEYTDLGSFLEDVALITDLDGMDEGGGRITLMTLHAAKGLEFPEVYIAGMEEGLFPGERVIASFDKEELEEERRLCYVGITRAMQRLTLSAAKTRMVNGQTRYAMLSRFISEIPEHLLEKRILDSPSYTERKMGSPFGDGLPWKKPVREADTAKLQFGKAFVLAKPAALAYAVGDRVRHIKFGIGKVEEIEELDEDYRVAVSFEKYGIKRMSAAFAKLEKL